MNTEIVAHLARIMHHHKSGVPYKEIGKVTISAADRAFLSGCSDYIDILLESMFAEGRNVGRSEGIDAMASNSRSYSSS